MALDKATIKKRTRRALDPVVALLSSCGVSPIIVSVAGLVAAFCGAYVIASGSLFWGGIWTLVSGICDVLDGGLARYRGQETKFGAFVDSTFDRVSEFVVYGALLLYFGQRGYPPLLLFVIWMALGASFLTSYARARIEGLGYACAVGILERPERMSLLIAGLVLGRRALVMALILIAAGATVTVVQRIRYARRVTRREP